jgi:hypothetical protein
MLFEIFCYTTPNFRSLVRFMSLQCLEISRDESFKV